MWNLVGGDRRHGGLTVFPLITPVPVELPYLLLADALEERAVTLTEVGEGSVPELLARNRAPVDVLVLDGEQLVGARQNRMTNRSLLLPAGADTVIPVYCMEQGRWHFESPEFAPAKQGAPSSVRRHARELEARLARDGAASSYEALSSAQGVVWGAIADAETLHGGASPTHALNELYEKRAADLDAAMTRFPLVDDQVGVLCFAGEAVLGLDLVGAPALWARLHERLLRGYVLDALAAPPPRPEKVDGPTAEAFLDAVREAERVPAQTVGNGRYAVLKGEVVGGELADEPGVLHVCAFPRRETGRREPERPRRGDEAPPLARPIERWWRE